MTYPNLSALADFPGWQAARAARAVGPEPGADALRRAYLELLKLCLCDLGATTTVSVGKWEDGSLSSRELRGETLRLRAAGMDWPMHGLTMVGLNRLDDLQSCVESVVREDAEGDLIEAGSWRGGASILMRATLDSLGATDRTVWVADSFQGFPEADAQGHLNVTDFLAVPLEEVRANFARFGVGAGVRFVPGFFEETLPGLSDGPWAIVRLDGDTYEATATALESLYPALSVGGHLIVDDYVAMPECGRATDAFRLQHGIDEPIEQVDWTCVRWRRERSAPLEAASATNGRPHVHGVRRLRAGDRPPRPVLSERELELTGELERLAQRLAAAEAEIDRLHSAPLRGTRTWLRRKLRAGGRPV